MFQFGSFQGNDEHSASRHGLQRVGAKVHSHLMQIGRIADDRRVPGLKPGVEPNVARERSDEQLERLADHPLHIEQHLITPGCCG